MSFEKVLNDLASLQLESEEIKKFKDRENSFKISSAQIKKNLQDLIWIRDLMNEQLELDSESNNNNDCQFSVWLENFKRVEKDYKISIMKTTIASPIQKAEKAILTFSELLDTSDVFDLAKTLYDQERIVEALRLFTILYESDKATLGPHHLHTLYMQNHIGGCLKKLMEFDKALDLFSFLYEKHMYILEPDHEDTLVDANNIAMILHDQGKYKEAMQWYQEVYDGQRQRLNSPPEPGHKEDLQHRHQLQLHQLTTQFRMAECLEALVQYKAALDLFQRVYANYYQILGPNHVNTLTVQHNIAFLLQKEGKLKEALKIYEQVYPVEVDIFGVKHPATLNTKLIIEDILQELTMKEELNYSEC